MTVLGKLMTPITVTRKHAHTGHRGTTGTLALNPAEKECEVVIDRAWGKEAALACQTSWNDAMTASALHGQTGQIGNPALHPAMADFGSENATASASASATEATPNKKESAILQAAQSTACGTHGVHVPLPAPV